MTTNIDFIMNSCPQHSWVGGVHDVDVPEITRQMSEIIDIDWNLFFSTSSLLSILVDLSQLKNGKAHVRMKSSQLSLKGTVMWLPIQALIDLSLVFCDTPDIVKAWEISQEEEEEVSIIIKNHGNTVAPLPVKEMYDLYKRHFN